jgi:hypothetical protein
MTGITTGVMVRTHTTGADGRRQRRPVRLPFSIQEAAMGRGLLLWLIGVPIPVIILLWFFFGR